MSKLMMFDFACEAGHKHEDLVSPDTRDIPCPECGQKATRLVAAPHFDPRMGTDSAFPTFAKKWERKQRQRQKQVEYLRSEHGDTR